jgi:hemerythrin
MGDQQEDLFPWSEKYRVGIAFADVQHKQLVDLINLLHQGLQEGKARVEIGKILERLILYTNAHFAAEEKVLQNCGYPDFLAHHTEHECLAYAVMEFYQELMRHEIEMTAQAVDFLKGWLGKEILDFDLKFAPFLMGKGVR